MLKQARDAMTFTIVLLMLTVMLAAAIQDLAAEY